MRNRFVILLLLVISAVAHASESVFARNGVRAIELAPDAAHFALFKRQADIDELLVISVRETRIANQRITRTPERIHSIEWIDSQRLAVQVGEQAPNETFPHATGQIDLLSIAGKTSRLAVPGIASGDARLSVVSGLRRLTGTVLIENLDDSTLHQVNLVTGDSREIGYPPMTEASLKVSPGLRIVVATGRSGKSEQVMYLQPNAGDGWTTINGAMQPLSISDSGNLHALYSANGGPLGLVAVDVFSGDIETLFQDSESDVDLVLFNSAGAPYAVRYMPGFPSWQYLENDPVLIGLHKSLRAAAPQHDVTFISSGGSDSLVVAEFYTNDRPSTYFLVDTGTGGTEKLLTADSGLWVAGGEEVAAYSFQPFNTQTASGSNVRGYISIPSRSRGLSRPLVVLIRDRLVQSPWKWEFDVDTWFLNKQGYNVLMVNHKLEDAESAIAEIKAAIDWAKTNDFISDDRVCLFGRGSGGNLALLSVALNDSLACAINLIGDSDDVADIAAAFQATAGESDSLDMLLVFGADDEQRFAAYSELGALVAQAGGDLEVFLVPGESGPFTSGVSEARAIAQIERFLHESIGAGRSSHGLPLEYYQAVSLSNLLRSFESDFLPDGRRVMMRAWFQDNAVDFRAMLSAEQNEIFDLFLNEINESLRDNVRYMGPAFTGPSATSPFAARPPRSTVE